MASFTTKALPAGVDLITATYRQSTDFATSTSLVLNQVVNASSNAAGATPITMGVLDQALGALGDERRTDALITDLAALQVSAPRRRP